MSRTSLLERSVAPDHHDDWNVLNFALGQVGEVSQVEIRGYGKDRYGFVNAEHFVAAGPDPTPLPSQDDWDF
jgi:hypothetical protein